jgi:predicted nucleic acid-binding protein
MRAVIDTNILVRAMLKRRGSVGPVVDFLRDGHYVCLYSEATLNELIDVLGERQ